jgi:hypothetical protein
MYKEDNNIGFRCVPANHLTLMSKSKELLDRNRNNLCEWRLFRFSIFLQRDYQMNFILTTQRAGWKRHVRFNYNIFRYSRLEHQQPIVY